MKVGDVGKITNTGAMYTTHTAFFIDNGFKDKLSQYKQSQEGNNYIYGHELREYKFKIIYIGLGHQGETILLIRGKLGVFLIHDRGFHVIKEAADDKVKQAKINRL